MPRYAFDAICWDFDGTIVDTEPVWMAMETEVTTLLGRPATPDFVESLVGGSTDRTVRAIQEWTGSDISDAELLEMMLSRAAHGFATVDVPWKPGAHRLLHEAHAAGIAQALVTATPRRVLNGMISRMDVPFQVVVAGDDVTVGKPDPEGYLMAMGQLGVTPERTLVIEDSVNGANAGNASGATVLVVPGIVTPGPAPRRGRMTLVNATLTALSAQVEELRRG